MMTRMDRYEDRAGQGMDRLNNNIEKMLDIIAKKQYGTDRNID